MKKLMLLAAGALLAAVSFGAQAAPPNVENLYSTKMGSRSAENVAGGKIEKTLVDDVGKLGAMTVRNYTGPGNDTTVVYTRDMSGGKIGKGTVDKTKYSFDVAGGIGLKLGGAAGGVQSLGNHYAFDKNVSGQVVGAKTLVGLRRADAPMTWRMKAKYYQYNHDAPLRI